MATKAEAKQLAAETLKLVPIGQAMQSQHDTRMGEAYDEVYAMLQVKGLAIWATSAEMPDEITPHFVALMAHNKKDIIGVSPEVYQRIILMTGADGEKSITAIRMMVTDGYETGDDLTDY